jgi:uncharacterized membrane protein YedE/YeeE
MRPFNALLMGALFGAGLALSGMTNPARVLGFLDLFGEWDPTLAFVMGGGLLVTVPAFALIRRRGQPLFETRFFLPTRQDVDSRLVLGGVLFGVGWGLGGFCPGPAIAALHTLLPEVALFVLAMLVGMLFHDRVIAR